jgi:hypothetical protein
VILKQFSFISHFVVVRLSVLSHFLLKTFRAKSCDPWIINLQGRASAWIASISPVVVDVAVEIYGSVGAISVGCDGYEAHRSDRRMRMLED